MSGCVCLWARSAGYELVGIIVATNKADKAMRVEGISDRRIRIRDGPEKSTSAQRWHPPCEQGQVKTAALQGYWHLGQRGQGKDPRRSPCPGPRREGCIWRCRCIWELGT